MMLKQSFEVWKSKSDLAKLQYAYAYVVLFTLVLAGLVGLLNSSVSLRILNVTGIAGTAFLVNLLAFALVNMISDDSGHKGSSTSKNLSKK